MRVISNIMIRRRERGGKAPTALFYKEPSTIRSNLRLYFFRVPQIEKRWSWPIFRDTVELG